MNSPGYETAPDKSGSAISWGFEETGFIRCLDVALGLHLRAGFGINKERFSP
jgi:hypothetical protein